MAGEADGDVMDAQQERFRLEQQIAQARDAVVRTAMRLDQCATEFDGDLDFCTEWVDVLWNACDRLRALETDQPPPSGETC